ncbi:hypothetical protein PYW08_004946 [Mythimna loreyi]|uniref:Uncharacterized protein n=1 Tax=Mythimna loreyi TaxID=667449 RepID=A0ACC2QHN5_9NEOP|nr:hypothetical protein PYW08_004946 [Mythimna loreyi]
MAGHESYACIKRPGIVELPVYSIYLIAFTYLIMFLAIIWLSAILYLNKKKTLVLKIDHSNIQHESFEEPNKNSGSTLTVNSGVIQISEPRPSDPITPTRAEDSRIVFVKKSIKPPVPMLDKVQMDKLCKEVLNKVAKTDSACYRDLNELLKYVNKDDNSSTKGAKENKEEESTELEPVVLFKLKTPDIKKTNKETKNETKMEIKDETKQETKNESLKESETQTKLDESKDVRIEINDVENVKNETDSDSATEYDTVPSPIRYRHSGPDPEQTMYDTVPSPMRFRHSGPDHEQVMYDTVPSPMRFRHSDPEPDQGMYDTVTSVHRIRDSGANTDNDIPYPLYDLPPMRNHDGPSQNVIQMDSESQYLLPISTEHTDSCYINAKTAKS